MNNYPDFLIYIASIFREEVSRPIELATHFNVISFMRFTVPTTSTLAQAMVVFHGVRKFLFSKGFQPYFSTISKIEYVHIGKNEVAEVNEVTTINNELVMLILECEDQFLICTPSWGIAGGDPIVVARNEMVQITYFDNLPQE